MNINKASKSNNAHTMSSSDSSSFSTIGSSFFSSSTAAAPDDAAGTADPAAGAPPPEPTFDNSSLTFFPSRALARRVAQIGSISTPAADVKVTILSA